MNIILFDTPELHIALRPLSFTRPVADMRVGILTIAEKWAKHTRAQISYLAEEYLQVKYKVQHQARQLYVNGALCPSPVLLDAVTNLPVGCALFYKSTPLAFCTDTQFQRSKELLFNMLHAQRVEFMDEFSIVRHPWDIFRLNKQEIVADFKLLTHKRKSQPITDKHTIVYNAANIFLEEGASVKAAILNAEEGPIYLGKDSVVHEGAIIKGAFALGEGAHINMGAKIKGDTTVGPHCKVGGEVSNSVMFGFSNKGHDGFMGNSVLGEWCNLGADTNTSNLKNNYSEVRVWSYTQDKSIRTGLQFCGLIMGDHAKSGINTMFNTGTVAGVSANVFGGGFPPKFIPSFSWGGAEGFEPFRLEKAYEVAERMMQRRHIDLTPEDKQILAHIFDIEDNNRQQIPGGEDR